MAEPETMSQRRTREEAAETARVAKERAEAAAKALGGLSGKAADELKGYKSKLDKQIEDAGG